MADPLCAYYALPYPLKSAVAGLYGRRLQRQRYGPDTDRLISEAAAVEWWEPQRIADSRAERLTEVLRRAAAVVPHYRQTFGDRIPQSMWGELGSWPVLSKETVRSNPCAFVAEDIDPGGCHEVHTSGSTGTPLKLTVSRDGVRAWYALAEARWRRWHGVRRDDRWAMIGGRMVASPGRRRPPYWVWNRPMRQLYLSAYHLAPATVGDYVDAMRRHRVKYLLGYPSAIFEVARAAAERGVVCPRLKVVIGNAEPLLQEQRSVIERAFGCPVRDTYGMAEMVAAAGECEHGAMHLWPEVGVVEVLDENDRPLPEGEIGRLVCTGLLNDAMPLVRYDVGDRGAVAPADERCTCGRTLPILRSIEGRVDDVVVTPDGRRIGRLDTVFKADLPIRLAQIVQEEGGRLVVTVVPAQGYNGTAADRIRQRLRERVGGLDIELREAADIPPGPAGKRRGVISKLDGSRGEAV